MQTPSETQINKFLAYLSELEIFKWNHVGDLEPDEDLVSVVNWLKDNPPVKRSGVSLALLIKGGTPPAYFNVMMKGE